MRVGVIGLGSMGRNHARVLSEIADLVVVCDANRSVVHGWSGRVARCTDPMAMLDGNEFVLDAVVVATPTSTHRKVATAAINAGMDVLVEKPLTGNVIDAQMLVDAAEKKGVFLATGHIERFNPAIVALKDRLEQLGEIREIGFERLGPFPARVRDTGVIHDLGTHDFDLLAYLVGSKVASMTGEAVMKDMGTSVVTSGVTSVVDVSVAGVARLENGVIATFREGWTTPTKIRRVTVWGERGMFVADLLRQELTFYANDYEPIDWESMEPFFGVSEGDVTRYKIEKREPLRLELQAFLDAANGQSSWCPTGEDGLEAVRLAERMKKAVS